MKKKNLIPNSVFENWFKPNKTSSLGFGLTKTIKKNSILISVFENWFRPDKTGSLGFGLIKTIKKNLILNSVFENLFKLTQNRLNWFSNNTYSWFWAN